MKKNVREASLEDERLLMSVKQNYADPVVVRGKTFNIKWLHPATAEWITALMLKEGNDGKILSQAAALIVLNGFWKTHLFYWFVWRWFYYIKQYNSIELMPIIEMGQKKTQQEARMAYLNATTLLTALRDTIKQMTKAEAEHFLQELRTAKGGKSPKSTE